MNEKDYQNNNIMDSKRAIAVLHNNQYQKHLGNGEYDYIHPLTDAEAKAIESLLERQERMIGIAIAEVRRLHNELQEAQATIDTHNEMIERQHSEIGRLNKLLDMRCMNCHLRKESEVADNG
jgi:hypothetical protein